MTRCPACNREYEDEARFCPFDGMAVQGSSPPAPADRALAIGEIVAGRYRIEAKRRDGLITVFGGTDLNTQQPILIKTLRADLGADVSKTDLLLVEAKQFDRIKVPNVARVLDYAGVTAEHPAYLVITHPEGKTLKDRLAESGPFSEQQATQVLRQVCAAMGAIHSHGGLLRGLSPENVWLDFRSVEQPHVQVECVWISAPIDAGGSHSSPSAKPVSNAAYSSPEECKGEVADTRSDIYRLGLLAYEIIAGRPPFEAESDADLISMHLDEAPRPIDLVAPSVAVRNQIERTIMRALAKLPQFRPRSASEFAQELAVADQPARTTTILENKAGRDILDSGPQTTSRSTTVLSGTQADQRSPESAAPLPNTIAEDALLPVTEQMAHEADGEGWRDPSADVSFESESQSDFYEEPARILFRESTSDRRLVGLDPDDAEPTAPNAVAPEAPNAIDAPDDSSIPTVLLSADGEAKLQDEIPTKPVVATYSPATESIQADASQAADDAANRPTLFDADIQFTVYRAQIIQPLVWSTVIAIVHQSGQRAGEVAPERSSTEAKPAEAQKDNDPYKTVKEAVQAVPGDGEVSFVPTSPGIEFDPPRCTFRWKPGEHREEFRMRASAALDGQVSRGRLSVFLGAILIGELPLVVRVDSRHQSDEATYRESASIQPYRKVFASFSKRDSIIAEQVERLAERLGDRYLREVRDLREREVWGAKIEKLILEADVFQLFWSSNSMLSTFVQREWEYALALRRPNFVRPTYWEDPLPTLVDQNLPPDELTRLNFQRIGYTFSRQSTVDATGSKPVTGPLTSGRLKSPTAPLIPSVGRPLAEETEPTESLQAEPALETVAAPIAEQVAEVAEPAALSPEPAEPVTERISSGTEPIASFTQPVGSITEPVATVDEPTVAQIEVPVIEVIEVIEPSTAATEPVQPAREVPPTRPVVPPTKPVTPIAEPAMPAASDAKVSQAPGAPAGSEFEFNWTPPRDPQPERKPRRSIPELPSPHAARPSSTTPRNGEGAESGTPGGAVNVAPTRPAPESPAQFGSSLPATADRPSSFASQSQPQAGQINPNWPPLPAYQAPAPPKKAKVEPNLAFRVLVFLLIGAVFMLGFVFLLNRLWH